MSHDDQSTPGVVVLLRELLICGGILTVWVGALESLDASLPVSLAVMGDVAAILGMCRVTDRRRST